MSDWLMKTIRAEARRLLELAAGDDELRADLRALAKEILDSTAVPNRLPRAFRSIVNPPSPCGS